MDNGQWGIVDKNLELGNGEQWIRFRSQEVETTAFKDGRTPIVTRFENSRAYKEGRDVGGSFGIWSVRGKFNMDLGGTRHSPLGTVDKNYSIKKTFWQETIANYVCDR